MDISVFSISKNIRLPIHISNLDFERYYEILYEVYMIAELEDGDLIILNDGGTNKIFRVLDGGWGPSGYEEIFEEGD